MIINNDMKRLFGVLALAMMSVAGFAQSDDFGTILSVEADKKINKKFSVGLEAEMRTRDDVKKVDRWSAGVQASYKVSSWLKASAGYTFLYDNNEKASYYDDDDEVVTRDIGIRAGDLKRSAQYWGVRHRFDVSLTGSYKFGKLDLSLRERWQYTYRPEHTVDNRTIYYDEEEDEPVPAGISDGKSHTYKAKGKNVLRSRLQAEYKTKGFPITPFANVELFNGWALEKIRYTAGAEYKINKKNSVELFYRYQHVNDDSDDEPNRHIIGLTYKVKF